MSAIIKIQQQIAEGTDKMYIPSVPFLIRCCPFGLDEIYKTVTKQDTDNGRLNAIEDLFSLYD